MALSTGPITIKRISIRENNCAIQWIELHPLDSVIHFLTTKGLDYRKALRYGKTDNKKCANLSYNISAKLAE